MTTLLESNARPFGSGKGAVLSMVVHGALIAGAIAGTASVALPPREKVEEHPILYVAPPPPKVYVAPEPLPEVKKQPPSKAPRVATVRPRTPPPPRRTETPTPRPAAPTVQAPVSVPTTIPDIKVATAVPAVNIGNIPRVSEVVGPPEPSAASSLARSAVKSSNDGDVDGGGKRLGSGASNKAYNENQVERAVQVTRAAVPRYPEALRSVSVEGTVYVRYIVDARGRVEPGSIQIVSTPHKLFADAVRSALLEARYRPAQVGGQPVRQLVEQPFVFKLDR